MSATPRFHEVIRPPVWLIAFIYFMLFSMVVAIWAAFDNQATVIATVIALALGVMAIYMATSEITVDGDELRVGRAHIPLRYCGDVTILDSEDFVLVRTRYADPAAYFALIFWISKGVKVEITDTRDKTPYWLISTKRGEDLAQALRG